MDLRRLRYFCAVVERGNLTQAARALNMAQPPLSRRLRELEDEIGVTLFSREGRAMVPTPAGYHLYRRAGEILRDVEQAAQETVMMSRREYRVLRVGLTHLFQDYFSPLLLEIHRRNPQLEIGISVCDSSQLETLLSKRLIDIALMQKPSMRDGFDCVDLPPIKLVAVISRDLPSDEFTDTIPMKALGKFPKGKMCSSMLIPHNRLLRIFTLGCSDLLSPVFAPCLSLTITFTSSENKLRRRP